MDPQLITASEAASRLGVTHRRVNQLIACGALGSVKTGRSVAVSAADVAARANGGSRTGRPWSARSTWAVVWLVDGRTPDWVQERTLRRLRRTSRQVTVDELRARVESLVVRTSWTAPPSVLATVLREPGGVVGGPGTRPQLWLPAARAAGLPVRYGLEHGSDLVVVSVGGVWPFQAGDSLPQFLESNAAAAGR